MEENSIRIGVIADTHDLLRPEVLKALEGCGTILHGGDISSRKILNKLEKTAPVIAVRGNNDKEWAEDLPAFVDQTLHGLRLYMTHKKKDLPEDLTPYDLVVYGHSHKYEEKQEGKTVLLNPGSCGPRRFNQAITLAVLTLSKEGTLEEIRRVDIPHQGEPLKIRDIRKKDIEKIVKQVQKGRSYDQIARAMNLEEDLAEQICRLYLTHPGVDEEGIMKKMGL